ncbi:hypothetical protein ABVC40_00345 [Lactobacillus iners]|uniref:hypothetical protein n=1 Tax=Lactobacillus iners TaxID=147802 RepID=UPI0001E5DEB0|nr:hypothetical protein HMPREF9212_1435 [Lactobacillus iners LactinV 03V1-b]MCT7690768.1 hypothetical protein [Lactobacillus crispatus]MCT7739150.1 hypothetical protein [Lactobacillus iners]
MHNNEKILNIFRLRNEIEAEANSYLEQLKTRYEWSTDARKQFYQGRRAINDVKHELSIIGRKRAREAIRYENYISKLKSEASRLNDKHQDLYAKEDPYLSELSLINSYIDKSYIDSVNSYLQNNLRILGVKNIQGILEIIREIGIPNLESVSAINKNTGYLDAIIESEMCGYKLFFMSDNLNSFETDISIVAENLVNIELDEYADRLNEIKTSLVIRQEPARPISDKLEAYIDELRSKNVVLDSGYTAPEFTLPVYNSAKYLKRALREDREYKGTENALNRFLGTVDLLDMYYHTFYVQGGGTPRNYHGKTPKN